MAEPATNGKLVLPKVVSLGNLLSMIVTIVTVSAASFAGFEIFSYRVAALEIAVAALSGGGATKEELKSVEAADLSSRTDLHESVKELGSKLDSVITVQAQSAGELKGITATVTDLKDNVNDVKRQLQRAESKQP